MDTILNKIENKYYKFSTDKIKKIILLQQSGSYRKYYRITTENSSILGVYNPDNNENLAFLIFTKHFYHQGFNVPEILAEFKDENIYFIKDLGDETLYNFLQNTQNEDLKLLTYKKVVDELIKIQFKGIKGLDLSYAYPRESFDNQSIMWDLNYFKYFVLKIAKVPFNEQKLEDDYALFSDILTKVDMNYFLYRDFQSKNIMLKDNKVYFIDYQGGRKGAFYYDLASLLNDSKAKLSISFKQKIIDYYYSVISTKISISEETFLKNYYSYALIRVLQAFGAYGFRGVVENKINFIKNIPQAFKNVENLIKQASVLEKLPELKKSLIYLIEKSEFAGKFAKPKNQVIVSINSFSYKRAGYPEDKTGNGGGFAFDCRFLPNPGRETKYKQLTGKDKEVIEYLNAYIEVETFVSQSVEIIRKAVKNYAELGYTNLQVNFGCTGGQHRSVFCAEKTYQILSELYDIKCEIKHIQFPQLNL